MYDENIYRTNESQTQTKNRTHENCMNVKFCESIVMYDAPSKRIRGYRF